MSRPVLIRWIVACALLAALVVWVQRAFGWSEVLSAWSVLTPRDLVVTLGAVAVGYLARAWRLGSHFGPPVVGHTARSLRVMALHNALNNLLPARTGELSFPVLLRREFGIDAGRSVSSLLWLRVLDLGALVAIGAATVGWKEWGVAPAIGVAVVVLLVPQLVAWRAKPGESAGGWRKRLFSGLPRDRASAVQTPALTLLHWGAKLFAYGWLLHRFGQVPAAPAVLGAVAGEMTSVLPIHGLAGAGTYEAGVLLVLRPWGVEMEQAVIAAVNLHLFLLVVSLVVGVVALALESRRTGTTRA